MKRPIAPRRASRRIIGPDSKSLDLLPLLGIDAPKARQTLRTVAARPVLEKIGEKEYDVYLFEASDGPRPLVVEARVDRATQLLYSLETLVDRDGKRDAARHAYRARGESAGQRGFVRRRRCAHRRRPHRQGDRRARHGVDTSR